jgi:hypothetical protein
MTKIVRREEPQTPKVIVLEALDLLDARESDMTHADGGSLFCCQVLSTSLTVRAGEDLTLWILRANACCCDSPSQATPPKVAV